MHRLLGQMQRSKLLGDKLIHGLRAAQEEGMIGEIGVLLHQLHRHKTLFASRLLLVTEDIHHLQAFAALRQRVQLRFVGQLRRRARTVEQEHGVALIPVRHAACHGQKRRNAAAACNADDILAVPQGLIVELTGGLGHHKSVAHLGGFVEVFGHKARVFHRQHQLIFQGLLGRGDDGIGTADHTVSNFHLKGDILSRAEEGERIAVHPLEGQLPDGLGERPCGNQFHLHIAGMQLFGQHVGAVFLRQRFIFPLGQHLPAGGDQLFKPQHIHKPKDLLLEVHYAFASFFKSPTVCRPDRSPEI